MRAAELIMALVMGACSIALMVKSAELPIGWIPAEGPGGGAFPFWLAAAMLVCCVWIVVNWILKTSAVSRSEDPFMDSATLRMFCTVAGSLGVMIGLIHFIGVYFAVPLYLIFYLRYVGRHCWALTGALAAVIPIVTFFFFEIALNMTLPKGVEAIEVAVFYPLYEMFL
ncbi:MAG: putative tricarboxylic transport membrane protein [Gammaproteobacteria bacterium]